MGLIIAGVDEAGYGPLLGPLCVGFAALRVDGWQAGEAPPDLWTLLARAAKRSGERGRDGRLFFDDSKALKLPNDSKTRHPLARLEPGVLAMLALRGVSAATDVELFGALGAPCAGPAWYAGEPLDVPLAGDAATLGISVNLLRGAARDAGVSVVAIGCQRVDERAFNESVRRLGSKAGCVAECTAAALRRACEMAEASEGDRLLMVCDQHGGRRDYAVTVERGLPEGWRAVAIGSDSADHQLFAPGGDEAIGKIVFRQEAERAALPVALASMTAKYVRELMMTRFNRYWKTRAPEVKPTAGYWSDAQRWLDDMRAVITDEERNAMVRTR